MTEESSTTSHLSVAMTTKEMDKMQTTGGNGMVSSYTFGTIFYLILAVILIGIVGAVGNALVLYAMYVSKQHKKQMLIFNQNVMDFFGSFFVIITYSVHLSRPYLSGVFGYCLCIILLSENLIWSAINGSMVNLAIITVDRYLKVVYPVFSRKWQRPWVINTAMAVAWFVGFAYNIYAVIMSTAVIDGVCHSYMISDSLNMRLVNGILYPIFFYVMILAIFIFCYWRILLAIRRQAKVMASHSQAGPSNASQAQSHKIQSNVIKTMIIVSAFFAIAWAPYDVYCFLAGTHLVPSLSYSDSAFFATTFIALIYTCTNPFIYATKFDPVREVLVKMIPCKKNPVLPTVCAQIAEPRPWPANNKRAG